MRLHKNVLAKEASFPLGRRNDGGKPLRIQRRLVDKAQVLQTGYVRRKPARRSAVVMSVCERILVLNFGGRT
jgi:hypothetical protein